MEIASHSTFPAVSSREYNIFSKVALMLGSCCKNPDKMGNSGKIIFKGNKILRELYSRTTEATSRSLGARKVPVSVRAECLFYGQLVCKNLLSYKGGTAQKIKLSNS